MTRKTQSFRVYIRIPDLKSLIHDSAIRIPRKEPGLFIGTHTLNAYHIYTLIANHLIGESSRLEMWPQVQWGSVKTALEEIKQGVLTGEPPASPALCEVLQVFSQDLNRHLPPTLIAQGIERIVTGDMTTIQGTFRRILYNGEHLGKIVTAMGEHLCPVGMNSRDDLCKITYDSKVEIIFGYTRRHSFPKQSFRTWLLAQDVCDDQIGSLVKTLKIDTTLPKGRSYGSLHKCFADRQEKASTLAALDLAHHVYSNRL